MPDAGPGNVIGLGLGDATQELAGGALVGGDTPAVDQPVGLGAGRAHALASLPVR
jgi:hypothetical protein